MFLLGRSTWPDGLDVGVIAGFLMLVLLLPFAGYYFMAVDFRAWLRALRGALMVITQALPHFHGWANYHTPGCLRALGLSMPCTEMEVKEAYRRLAEQLHPDRGGDKRRFLALHEQLESSLAFLRQCQTAVDSNR